MPIGPMLLITFSKISTVTVLIVIENFGRAKLQVLSTTENTKGDFNLGSCKMDYILNSIGYSTVPETAINPPGSSSIAIKTSSGTSKGALIFQFTAGLNPNLG